MVASDVFTNGALFLVALVTFQAESGTAKEKEQNGNYKKLYCFIWNNVYVCLMCLILKGKTNVHFKLLIKMKNKHESEFKC